MGMAIAISAAATTKIRNTSTAPTVAPACCANATRLRLTPLSVSSMHISMTSALRRTITPSMPSTNSEMLTRSTNWVLSMLAWAQLDDRDRRHDDGDQQDGDELEIEPVVVQESRRERLHAESARRRRRRCVQSGTERVREQRDQG